MYLLPKITKNRYVSIILILVLWFVFSRTLFTFLSSVNFSVILYVLISHKIDDKTYIPYSIIFGLYSDYIISSYIGLNVLFFLFLSLIKMFSEYKFDSKSIFTVFVNSLFSIFIYNIFLSVVLDYKLGVSFLYILKQCAVDFIVFVACYFIMEFSRAFRSVKG